MKSCQQKKTFPNKLHSTDSSSSISHKPKARRKLVTALRKFSIKKKNSTSSKSTSDISEIDYSQFKYQKPVETKSSSNLWYSNLIFKAKPSSLFSEFSSMESGKKSPKPCLKKPEVRLIINPNDLPSVSASNNSHETSESRNFYSTFTDTRPLGTNFNFNNGLQAFNVLPSSFIAETSTTLNVPLAIALKEVLDLAVYFRESEMHIKQTLAKYITNEKLQCDLIKALFGHNKLQIENERRNYKLAKDLFKTELDHSKAREKALQDSLDVAAYFNRILEEEIQNLKRNNEELLLNNQNKRETTDEIINKNINTLYENNNDLRNKYHNAIGEIKKLDVELRSLQNQNRNLVTQLANTNGQLRNYRDMLHKEMGEHELEHVHLTHQLQLKEQVVKDCVEAGDILVEDLMLVKKQLKPLSLNINWTKFKERGNTLVDLLHISRNCINEITRQLTNTNKDSPRSGKNDLSNSYESKIKLQSQKILIMKSEIDLVKKEKEIIAESLNNEKLKLASHEKMIEELKSQITHKDLIMKGLNINLKECRDEIQTLTYKLNGIQKFFDENQLSHVLHDLFQAQEKCTNYEKQFQYLELEKLNLSEKARKFDYEKDNLLRYQKSFFEHLQQQQRDIEELNRQNDELKKQLNMEREKLIGKSAELAKQIEATNLMQTVQSQMNLEYSKNLSLEANALTTNYEINRLSVVADYNNEISKQLKEMLSAKEKTISELKTNLDKLNINEKKNLEEKAALCNEITEASYIIKQLQNELENEKYEKTKILNEKDGNEKNADSKIKELHQMIIDERQALRALLKEYQNVLNQKNNIEFLQREQLTQIESYTKNEEKMKIALQDCNEKCNDLAEQCSNLNRKLDEVYEIIRTKENKVKSSVNEYENKLSARDTIIEKQKTTNEELQNTIKYLQCNIKKLQSDLNELRTNEKEKVDQIKQCSILIDTFQKDVDDQKQNLEKCYKEKQQIEGQLTETILQYNSLYEEYNKFYEETQLMEEQFKLEIEKQKEINANKTKNLELYEKRSRDNLEQLERKRLEINRIKEEMERLDKVRNEFSEKTRILEEALNKQQRFDETLIQEKDRCLQKVKNLTKAVNSLKADLYNCLKQRDEDIMNFKKFTTEIKHDSEIHKKIMRDDLYKLSRELSELNEKFTIKSTKLHDLRHEYKEMTENMKKVLNLLIKERYEHKIVEAQNQLLIKELEEMKHKCITQNCLALKQEDILPTLEHAKRTLEEALINLEYLEKQVHLTTEKLRKLEEITIMQENYMTSQLQNRADLLKTINREHEILLERYNKLKQHSKMTNKIIITLKAEITHLNQQIQILEFQKCDLMLKNKELNGQLQNEQSLNRTLKQTHQQLIAAAYEMSSPSSVQSITYNLD